MQTDTGRTRTTGRVVRILRDAPEAEGGTDARLAIVAWDGWPEGAAHQTWERAHADLRRGMRARICTECGGACVPALQEWHGEEAEAQETVVCAACLPAYRAAHPARCSRCGGGAGDPSCGKTEHDTL